MNKLWKQFSRFTDDCYLNMIGAGKDKDIWHKTFDTLIQAIEEERSKNPDFGKELFRIDDDTDFEYGVEDWLMDYLDELGMHKMYEKQYEVCEKIIGMFAWKEESPADFRFEMASALGKMGKIDEAVAFCEKWFEEEPEAELSEVALIYAKINAKDFGGAEQLVGKHLSKGDACTEENELVYRAAVRLYEEKGDKKTAKQMKKSLEKYENDVDRKMMEEMEEYPFGADLDEWDDLFDEMPGPFDDDEYDDEWEDDADFEDEEDDEAMGEILPFQ